MATIPKLGFHGSFDRYYEWWKTQRKACLPTCSWGTWWAREQGYIKPDEYECNICGQVVKDLPPKHECLESE